MSTQIYPNAFGSSSASVEVNATLVPGTPNFNSVLPLPPTGETAVSFNFDGSGNIVASAHLLHNFSIQVNSIPVSDDYDIGVNLALGVTESPVLINGA